MTKSVAAVPSSRVSALVVAAGSSAQTRFWEFFVANIRNKHTRRAYALAVREFLAWCERAGVESITDVQPLHVAAHVEQLGRERSVPTVKQHLAAIKHLFDWLVTGQVIPVNPASSVRGPSHSVKRGMTPVLDPSEARTLLGSIDVTKPIGLRDRALIGLMVYSFARIGAAITEPLGPTLHQDSIRPRLTAAHIRATNMGFSFYTRLSTLAEMPFLVKIFP